MPLINSRVKRSLTWIHNCVLTMAAFAANTNAAGADRAIFKIADAKLCVPLLLFLLHSSYQGVKRLFVLACDDTEGDN